MLGTKMEPSSVVLLMDMVQKIGKIGDSISGLFHSLSAQSYIYISLEVHCLVFDGAC